MTRPGERRQVVLEIRPIVANCVLMLAAVFLAVIIPTKIALSQVEPSKSKELTVLYTFTGGKDGGAPATGLVADGAGNLFGTTQFGGDPRCNSGSGCGTVFKIDKAGKETVLHSFTLTPDGAVPVGDLLLASDGTLYGTTAFGGTSTNCQSGCGTVFRINKSGKEKILYSFKGGTDGMRPLAGLAKDNDNNLLGTTEYGGTAGLGTVFKLDKVRKETVLYSFRGGTDGNVPLSRLVVDRKNNLYGTTYFGGGSSNGGTVFKIDKAGKETVFYSFPATRNAGLGPRSGLILDKAGNLYGTTAFYSTVFKLDRAGKEKVLYWFPSNESGVSPQAALLQDTAGNLYGTTGSGGFNDCGVVFKITVAGKYELLYSFLGLKDGAYPISDLIMDSVGNLYGTASGGGAHGAGVVFKIEQGGR